MNSVERFQQHEPRTLRDIMVLAEVPLTYVHSGVFRDAFKTEDGLIVKVPINAEGREHSLTEIRIRRRILTFRKYEALKKYMPQVLYHNSSGIILMPEYRQKRLGMAIRQNIGKEFKAALGLADWDWHWRNFGLDGKQPILIDLGCLNDECEDATS
jgi:hypothetical protein